ncbi:Phenylacetaldehyde oxime monooxygenase CYP71AN24, partial [Cucurbita argyrosperma subsp. sororia]
MVLVATFCVADIFPCLWWIDVIRGFNKELKDCFKTLDTFLSKVVEEHNAKIRDGVLTDESKKDFVDIMLQLQQDDMVDYPFCPDSLKAILLASVGGEAVNLSQLFLQTSNNIVSRCVLGEKFEDENGNSQFGDTARKLMVLIVAFCVADLFPSLWWIDVIRGFNKELKDCFKTLDTFFSKVVEEHKEKIRAGVLTDEFKKDFVDIMLQLQQDDMVDYHFSSDQLKAIILVSFLSI